MRFLGILLLVIGMGLLVDAIQDQRSGIASVVSPSSSAALNEEAEEDDPEAFRNLMAYQWIRASLTIGAGLFCLAVLRRMDRTELFSPENRQIDRTDFGGDT